MVCVDTNCIIAYLSGDDSSDIEFFDKLLRRGLAAVPPVVVTELLSDPALPHEAEVLIGSLPVLSVDEGYWQRSGRLRAKLGANGFRVGLGDALVAQACIDYDAPLLTRDKGFQRFRKVGGLKLV